MFMVIYKIQYNKIHIKINNLRIDFYMDFNFAYAI